MYAFRITCSNSQNRKGLFPIILCVNHAAFVGLAYGADSLQSRFLCRLGIRGTGLRGATISEKEEWNKVKNSQKTAIDLTVIACIICGRWDFVLVSHRSVADVVACVQWTATVLISFVVTAAFPCGFRDVPRHMKLRLQLVSRRSRVRRRPLVSAQNDENRVYANPTCGSR